MNFHVISPEPVFSERRNRRGSTSSRKSTGRTSSQGKNSCISHNNTILFSKRDREDEFEMGNHIFISTDYTPPRKNDRRIEYIVMGDGINWSNGEVSTPDVSVMERELRRHASPPQRWRENKSRAARLEERRVTNFEPIRQNKHKAHDNM